MLPPTLNSSTGVAAEKGTNLFSKCVSASMGSMGMNRQPVKRRLFSDDSPENSPPDFSVKAKLRDLFSAEKERALRKWGFDLTTESPSTSSQFEWTAMEASRVPNYYVRAYGANTNATFSPKYKDRLTMITPSSESSASWKLVWKQPKSVADAGPSSRDADKSTNCEPEEISARKPAAHVDVTPAKSGGETKSKANNPPTSRQVRLTDFYKQRKRAADASASPNKNRKRSAIDPNEASQGEASTSIFRS